ncbi:tetratricopeptide repeat protein [Bacteroides clarus CAG:160]|uniref:tetratricopeptide repeat protein n=1 Tax=Bacteroides clarus TaxID=626929 RepID=UPI000340005F|nr:tetratricopeptide repeat protein [Bacteroides clarus]CDB81677.1 tetratricopeptide repeat protein [Bacteroides clarus CAG:160]
MNEQAIQEQYQHIVSLLEQKRLKEAQIQLEAFLWNCNDWTLRNRLEQAKVSYQYMLQYMRQGVNDPERQKLYRQLLAETRELGEQARISLLDEVSTHYYHALHKNKRNMEAGYGMSSWLKVLESFPDDMAVCQLMPDNKQSLDSALQRHEETAQYLFLTTWGNSGWTAEEEREARMYLESELLPINDLCLFTGAVLLSLMECFDPRKFSWLLDAATHADTQVSQRALVIIAIVLHIHPNRLWLYPELEARLSLLNEDGSFGKQLNRVYIQLLRSQETEKIDKKMREEIIPEMMKNVSIMRNMKYGFEENMDEDDRNPDWEKAFEESGLGDKIREMNELQLEGADVYMSTFAQLKSYPFFQNPHNWFYPFDMQHSGIIREFGLKPTGDNAILSLILQSGFFCNSDKYSLCFTMAHIPQAQRNMMLSQMTSQDLNELMDESKSSGLRQYAQRPDVISNQYIHDLYRFFKLSQRRHEFRDIFKEEIALHRIPALKDILRKPELLVTIADFHFRKEHPAEALGIYQEVIDMNYADADIFQKTGYCLQKEKRYKEAISAYRKADVLKPDHIWTIRHLATCYRQLRDFASALEYYRKVEAMQPENRNVTFFIGSCLAEQERYEEALQCFFKLDLMENDCIKAWRAIGWCSFVSGKSEQAMRYYEKVLALKPIATDYLNAGHVALRLGNMEKAAELYGKAASESGNRETFLEMFDKDKETLIKLGIDENDIPLIRDLV